MRNRARRCELTCGNCRPGWLEEAGLKSSTGGDVCSRAASPGAACGTARPSGATVRRSDIPPASHMLTILRPDVIGPLLARAYGHVLNPGATVTSRRRRPNQNRGAWGAGARLEEVR